MILRRLIAATSRMLYVAIPLGAAMTPAAFADDGRDLRVDQWRIAARIEQLAQFGANPEGGVSRVAFSEADLAAREFIKGEMREAGLEVRVDAAGNIIGRRAGTDPALPAIMTGSHIDSVPGGGNYDGDVGVIAAIEVAQVLGERGIELRHPLEIVSFTDEEGFFIGSLAMTGRLKPATLDAVGQSGRRIREGLAAVGGDAAHLDRAIREPGELAAFLELHIEQGAFLYAEHTNVGVVEGIVGIRWWDVTIDGVANHAGTTPMNQRRDALVSAAQLVLAVEKVAASMPGRQVATVGRIRAEPGAPNVIPGRVVMKLEIRDLEAQKMQRMFDQIEKEAAQIAGTRATPIRFAEVGGGAEPALTDPRMRAIVAAAAGRLGLSYKPMPSGAGHDSQNMTHVAPTGMIFVPSVDGISHSPKEFTSPEDMANGANVLLHSLLAIDDGALEPR